MALTVSCAFARVAVKELFMKHSKPHQKLPQGAINTIHADFTALFPRFYIDLQTAKKRFPAINKVFNKKWHPDTAKKLYLTTYSTSNWQALPESEKQQHSLRECTACTASCGSLYNCFPSGKKATKENTITLTVEKNSAPEKVGKYVLSQLGSFVEKQTGASLQEILANTPKSNLTQKPSSNKKLDEKRKVEREFRKKIETEYEKMDTNLVMANRMSWNTYDKLRKNETLEGRSRKRQAEGSLGNTPKRKKHGGDNCILLLDTEQLLDEARAWPSEKIVNWSELAKSYGLTQKNAGQSIKEFLASKDIEQAKKHQRPLRAHRRAKKKSSHGVSFPMHAPATTHKQTIKEKIEKKEILIGDKIVEQDITSYRVNHNTHTIEKVTNTHFARHIKLSDIRTKMMEDHKKLGLIRDSSDDYISKLSDEEVVSWLTQLGLSGSGLVSELRNRLENACRTRYLKIWHDHSEIAGHGHLLVLVAAIYDPAFFYTSKELEDRGIYLDVQSVVERPYIHILGRSRSSLEDQAQFHQYRLECIKELSSTVKTVDSYTIRDVVRIFHGDGPAQQVEAGAKIGGTYPCVGCTASSSLFNDLAYCYRADSLGIAERKQFVTTGIAWKKGGTKPLDGLGVAELRSELNAHGIHTTNKTKKQLQPIFDNLRKGINHVPALIQACPTTTLTAVNLDRYEIIPTEPLHDLKGHVSNLIEETLASETGIIKDVIQEVVRTALCKETLRCSDYRKAIILIYKSLLDTNCRDTLIEIYRTAVEMSELLYAHSEKRDTTSVLRLHNLLFIHGMLCIQKYGIPKAMTSGKFFGRYFHSLTCHAALTYRQISLRSVNTETQERMFQASKSITRTTSNQHPDHIVTNIIQRLHEEQESKLSPDCITREESEIRSLSSTLPDKQNTIFKKDWIMRHSSHYQAHLERIADYLIYGQGIWWNETDSSVTFFDVSPLTITPPGPELKHFRDTSTQDIRMSLLQQWESCCDSNLKLPIATLRQYNSNGNLCSIITS